MSGLQSDTPLQVLLTCYERPRSSRVVGPSCPVVHSPRFVVYPLWRGVVSKPRSRPPHHFTSASGMGFVVRFQGSTT